MQDSAALPPPNSVIPNDGEIAPLPPMAPPATAKAPAVARSNGAAHETTNSAAAKPAAKTTPAAPDKVKAKGCFCFA